MQLYIYTRKITYYFLKTKLFNYYGLFLSRSTTETSGPSPQENKHKAKTSEPNIDFELDVKVHINSGKCVLHTKEPARDDDIKM